MRLISGIHRTDVAPACALTIGNFDCVHRGHQAMLALLTSEARHRGLPSCVLTFEPHPRDYFARRAGHPEKAPARISTLRDKLTELERCGVDQVVLLRFNELLANASAEDFVTKGLVGHLGAKYVLVGDDFRFGAQRRGDYAMLDRLGEQHGFDVARMLSYEVHGQRVSSSLVREALAAGDMAKVSAMMGRTYSISGHVIHGAKLGRELGFRTLNLRFPGGKPAAAGIFVVQVNGLGRPLPGVASMGVRPTVENAGRVLLEVHCLDWPAELGPEGAYGREVSVSFMHKLHDERRYESLEALRAGIDQDVLDARAWWAAHPPRG